MRPLNWFADSTPGDNVEFSFADTVNGAGQPLYSQRLYSQLTPAISRPIFRGPRLLVALK